ncbi:MAG: hypothetical protein ACC628_02555 [Pirellulaceae bacterium]
MASVHDFVRWLLYIVLATLCVAAFVFYFVHTRLDEAIRRHIEARFQSHYAELQVTVRSARRVPGAGIQIRELVIRDPRQPPQQGPMAYVDEMLVQCDTDLGGLVKGQICTDQIIARRLRLYVRQQADGSWNARSLFPTPQFGDRPPPVIIENATIEFAPLPESGSPPVTLHDVNVTVLPEVAGDTGNGNDQANSPGIRRIVGSVRSSLFETANIDGRIDLATSAWSMSAEVKGLDVSPDLVSFLPEHLASQASESMTFHGRADILCRVQGQSNDFASCRFAASGSYQGRIDGARLPQPLTDAHVTFRCNNEVVQIDEANAIAGGTHVSLSGKFYRDGRMDLHADARELLLDQRLSESLPVEWHSLWPKFKPEGLVNAQLDLSFDGQTWAHDLIVDGLDVSFSYYRFPYRLEKGSGRLRLKDGVVQLSNVRASANDREVRFEGRLANPGGPCLGWIEFSLAEPIPLNDRFISAIPAHNREFVQTLDPHGTITAWGRFERQAGNPPVEHKQLTLGLSNCSMNYKHFPYPLYRIRGTLSMTDDQWVFRDLEGYNDSGWIMCRGTWTPHAQGGTFLSLDFNAMDVPLEDELRNALKPELQNIWNTLHPRGTIDHLKIALRYASAVRDLSVEVSAIKRPPEQNVDGRSITVKPGWLPYRWDNVVGSVRFQNGVVELTNIQAEHGHTKTAFSGRMEIVPSGQWRVHLDPLIVDHVDTSHELTSALPAPLGSAVASLDITGLVSLSGRLELLGAGDPSVAPSASWNLVFDLENGGLDCGVPLEHIHGGVTLAGKTDGQHTVIRGELAVDSLTYQGIQLTDVKGPIHFEDTRLWIGEWIPQEQAPGPRRPAMAGLWGGNLAWNGLISLKEEAHFELEGTLIDGDVAAISREATSSRHDITGRAFANVILSGSGRGTHTLRGRGRVLLKDADLYRLPVMMRLLKPLSLKPPDHTAFDSSEVDFRIEADRIYFDRIDFDGDAISLDGRGEMNLQRQINLTFGTAIGRDDLYNSLLRPMLKEAGRRLVLLHVTGTLDQPHVRRELVPELNQTIQQLFPNQPREPRPATSRLLDPRRMFQRVLPR